MLNGFYPTPKAVISRLVEGLKFTSGVSVLDPSAGKGDILEAVKGLFYGHGQIDLYAIEINPELRPILTDKRFKVIGTDFLRHPGLQYFDYILMNPPFDEGAQHLLKAWDISNGAVIRCLLNAETILNPYTEERKRLVKIIERYGWYKELGPVFLEAERKTGVNVVLVHLQDTQTKKDFLSDFDPATVDSGADIDETTINNELAMANIFENYEARYNATVEAFKELLAARQKVIHYLTPIAKEFPGPGRLISDALDEGKSAGNSYKHFLETITRDAWDHLFQKTKMRAVTTEGVRKELEKMQTEQGLMAFTADNMEELFSTLFLSRENVMTQCVLEVFDQMTKYHPENREAYEGWKTNSAYKVGQRFILPNIGSAWFDGLDYRSLGKIADIEKALCFLSGKRLDDIVSVEKVYGQLPHYGEKMRSEFFETKMYKKRTMHFRWLDQALWAEFNTVVARERWGQLPEKVKKGAYA